MKIKNVIFVTVFSFVGLLQSVKAQASYPRQYANTLCRLNEDGYKQLQVIKNNILGLSRADQAVVFQPEIINKGQGECGGIRGNVYWLQTLVTLKVGTERRAD